MTKNADNDNYRYYGYGIGFDREGKFSVGNWFSRKYIYFGVDMNSSVYVDNKEKDILTFCESPSQELDGATLPPGKHYWINFAEKSN